MTSILVVDDQKPQRKNLAFYLKSQNFEVDTAESGEEALGKIETGYFDIVIADYKLEGMNGQDFMHLAQKKQPALEFIIMTAFGSIPLAIDFIRDGAADFLTKPFEYSTILDSIEKVLKRHQNQPSSNEPEALKMVAGSQKMKDIVDLASKAAGSDVSVLIEGEVGTGKELFAKIVHNQSHRYRNQFIIVECSTATEASLEKEIFGVSDTDCGVLAKADGGTLYLRDIDRLSPKLQGRLLRVIREGNYSVTDSTTVKRCDVRIIGGTTRNMKRQVTTGAFREDLYYHLNVMPVYMPALRSREGEILPLVKHFLAKYKSKSQRNIRAISPEVLSWMTSYDWPGNVREMENIIARACVLATGDVLDESLIFTLPQDRPEIEDEVTTGGGYLNLTLKDNQRTLILKALKQNSGNFSRTATQLGISRTTLWRRIKKFKIEGLPVEQE